MGPGKALIAEVRGLLKPKKQAQSAADIHKKITATASERAVRYAIRALVAEGAAIREGHKVFKAPPPRA